MEIRTFYSDETRYYRNPAEPEPFETVHILFRTGRYQVYGVTLCTEDAEIPMKWEFDRNNFDFYGADLVLEDKTVEYYFRIELMGSALYYGRAGIVWDIKSVVCFSVIPGFHVPEWSKGCLYYQIFPDRFCSGDPADHENDYHYCYGGSSLICSEWGDPIDPQTYRQFYGGDIKGIIEKLPYLADLGVDALYLNPVFASPSSHKYDCSDYEHIDFGFGSALDEEGSDRLFAELVSTAHEFDIKIVLDGVFNHCSSYHKWFDKSKRHGSDGAYGNPLSRYHNRFIFTNDACTDYEAWWGVKSLPKLNYEGDETLIDDIYEIGKKWVSPPYCADGWRLDVGADLGHTEEFNHRFWKGFRKAVREANENAIVFAEHYDDPSPWLNGEEWDSIMNYNAFMDPVSYFFTGLEKHSDIAHEEMKGDAGVFAQTLIWHSSKFPGISLFCALNQLDNHDHSRFLTRTNGETGRITELGAAAAETGVHRHVLRQAAAVMYFWPGSPGLYYGDEAGLCGFTDPDNRRCYPWDDPDREMLDYFMFLGKLRKRYPFFRDASCRIIYAEDGVFAFARFTDERALNVVVSASEEMTSADLPIWIAGIPGYDPVRYLECVLYCNAKGCSSVERIYVAHNGILKADIEPGSLFILIS